MAMRPMRQISRFRQVGNVPNQKALAVVAGELKYNSNACKKFALACIKTPGAKPVGSRDSVGVAFLANEYASKTSHPVQSKFGANRWWQQLVATARSIGIGVPRHALLALAAGRA